MDHRAFGSLEPVLISVDVLQIAVIAAAILCGGFLSYLALRFLRTRHHNPKYVPGQWLKQRWRAWNPGANDKRLSTALYSRPRSLAAGRSLSPATSQRILRSSMHLDLSDADLAVLRNAEAAGGGVDRNTSVRSIMTLPAYEPIVRPTEKILGRAGERAGIDTVVEFPETADEEEARREEAMEAMYSLRRDRREQRSAAEERRRLRREARAQGDHAAIVRLAQESRLAAQTRHSMAEQFEAAQRRSQHQERGRNVSSVSYSDIGIAKADGSRVRAGSSTSRHPLLASVASVGATESLAPPEPSFGRRLRTQSSASLRYLSLDVSDDDDEYETSRRTSMDAESVMRIGAARSRGASTSQLSINTINDHGIEHNEPPEYDIHRQPADDLDGEAPAYSPLARTNAPRLPAFAPLPAIEIITSSPTRPHHESSL